MEDRSIIFIAGIPASGKSTYGQWLDKEKGFLHLDVEQDGVLDKVGLRHSWNDIFENRSTARFIEDVNTKGKRVVINWGFPSSYVWVLEAFKAANIELWWFGGDENAAREVFLRRGTLPIACFERQMVSIRQAWCEIEALFGSRMIRAVSAGPRFLEHIEIFTLMFPNVS